MGIPTASGCTISSMGLLGPRRTPPDAAACCAKLRMARRPLGAPPVVGDVERLRGGGNRAAEGRPTAHHAHAAAATHAHAATALVAGRAMRGEPTAAAAAAVVVGVWVAAEAHVADRWIPEAATTAAHSRTVAARLAPVLRNGKAAAR